jgi:hypothetical protein
MLLVLDCKLRKSSLSLTMSPTTEIDSPDDSFRDTALITRMFQYSVVLLEDPLVLTSSSDEATSFVNGILYCCTLGSVHTTNQTLVHAILENPQLNLSTIRSERPIGMQETEASRHKRPTHIQYLKVCSDPSTNHKHIPSALPHSLDNVT